MKAVFVALGLLLSVLSTSHVDAQQVYLELDCREVKTLSRRDCGVGIVIQAGLTKVTLERDGRGSWSAAVVWGSEEARLLLMAAVATSPAYRAEGESIYPYLWGRVIFPVEDTSGSRFPIQVGHASLQTRFGASLTAGFVGR